MVEDDNFVIRGFPPLQPIPNTTVGKLIYEHLLSSSSDDPALVDAHTNLTLSYKQLLAKTCTLAESLRRNGYNKNTVISISSENSLEFFIPVIAALYIGAPVAPINQNYTEQETVHALNIARPKIIFCSEQVYEKFVELRKRLSFIEKIILIGCDEEIDGLESINTFTNRCLHNNIVYKFNVANLEPDDVSFILYSSGTTGLPKGVMITNKNVLVRFLHLMDPRLIPQRKQSGSLGLMPFFHAYGLFVGLGCIHKQVKIVVLQYFDPNLFLEILEKYKITELALVPTLAVFLAKSPLVDKYKLCVETVGCGAAPLSRNVEDLLKKRLKVKTIKQAYGLTESTLALMGIPEGVERTGSSGKLYPYILCKVRDLESGKSLGPNQIGELCFKGPIIMKGYYRNEEATKNAFTKDGWLLTGDLGYYDEEEYFYITGRIKELIKYKGFQVPPAELEAILLSHPKIKDAAVVGLPNEEAGELPLAFVVKNEEDLNLSENEVKQFVEGKVSNYKRLRGGVIFVEEIPKNPSGKILRGKLHEMLDEKKLKAKL